MQDVADVGHQPWLLSPELVSTSYARREAWPVSPGGAPGGPTAYQVRADHGEWEATLQLAQPVRHGAGGVSVVTLVGS
jgi:hypothetical protein